MSGILTSQYVCERCGAIVCVAAFMVLSPQQKAALGARLCHDCFGTQKREVKHL